MNEIRKKKIEHEIVKTIAKVLVSGEVKDPRIGIVSIHRAEISPDMEYVKIWVTSYCTEKEKKKLMEALNKAAGFFQAHFRELRLRVTPKISFLWDENMIKAYEINELIDKLAPKGEIASETPDST